MPKQILFYMTREDEVEFLTFLRTTGRMRVLPVMSPTSGFEEVNTLPESSQSEPSRRFWLQNTSINLPLVTEFDETRGAYTINGFQSPVVEFFRSLTISNVVLPGRIEADMMYYDDFSRDLLSKPAEFKDWFDVMESWIKKHYRHLTLLTYVGPKADDFRDRGGILH